MHTTQEPLLEGRFKNSAEMLDNIPFSHPKSLTLLPVCGSTIFKIANSAIKYNFIGGKRDILVTDLIHDDKRFLNLAEFNKKNNTNVNYLNYNSIISSVKNWI